MKVLWYFIVGNYYNSCFVFFRTQQIMLHMQRKTLLTEEVSVYSLNTLQSVSHLTCKKLIKICCSGLRQHATYWSAPMGSPRTSSAPSARPLTSASSSTCSVPQANCPPHMTGEVFMIHVNTHKSTYSLTQAHIQ